MTGKTFLLIYPFALSGRHGKVLSFILRYWEQRMPSITVPALNVNFPHDLHFTIDRPEGLAEYLLLHFHTPVEILTREGLVKANPGDCILYAPGVRQWYRGIGEGFRDDWMHVGGADVLKLVERYDLPTNVLIRPRDTRFFAPLYQAIRREMLLKLPFWEEAVAERVQETLRELARQLAPPARTKLSAAELGHLDLIRDVRLRVRDRLAEAWTVSRMAREAHLSASRFAVLYRKFFSVSPVEDLIRARLEQAEWLLSTTDLRVSDVAYQCGFTNVYHFSRLFRRRMGHPPSACARSRMIPGRP
jgi:AraC-like DNA-binding protein